MYMVPGESTQECVLEILLCVCRVSILSLYGIYMKRSRSRKCKEMLYTINFITRRVFWMHGKLFSDLVKKCFTRPCNCTDQSIAK